MKLEPQGKFFWLLQLFVWLPFLFLIFHIPGTLYTGGHFDLSTHQFYTNFQKSEFFPPQIFFLNFQQFKVNPQLFLQFMVVFQHFLQFMVVPQHF